MSHTATVKTEIKDVDTLRQVAEGLGYKVTTGLKEVRLFQDTERGENLTRVDIPGWSYPLVVKEDGTVAYDNYNGSWGDISKMHALQQGYAEAVTVNKAQQQGLRLLGRQLNQDGTIQLRFSR